MMIQEKNTLFHKIIPYIICATASTFYIYEYIIRVVPMGMTHELMRAFNIDAGGLGVLAAVFFLGYAPMQIPAGMLYDRFGARKLLTLTIALATLATLGFSLTTHFAIAAGFRLISGFASSFAYIGALVVGHSWFPRKYFALYAGIVQVFGSLGAILGSAPIATLTQQNGWQYTIHLIAYLGLIFTLLIWLIVRDQQHGAHKTNPQLASQHDKKIYKKAFKNPQTWRVAVFGFFIWAPVVVFAALWGTPYIQQAYMVSKVHAASIVSSIWIGVAIGGPFLGWYSGHIKRRKLPLIFASLLGILTASMVLFMPKMSLLLLAIILFLFGFAASAQGITFGITTEINPKKAAGAVIGFTNMSIIAGGIVFQPLVGLILRSQWNGAQLTNIPVYSTHNYQVALALVPLSFLFALIIAVFFIKETYCKQQTE